MANSINFGSDYDLDEHRMSKDNDNHIGTGKYTMSIRPLIQMLIIPLIIIMEEWKLLIK